ncbi:MAG: hypothetical protein Q4B14_04785, partial [Clostridia bacterium]|nr:hypothetical protein [Clostridia bacterium]
GFKGFKDAKDKEEEKKKLDDEKLYESAEIQDYTEMTFEQVEDDLKKIDEMDLEPESKKDEKLLSTVSESSGYNEENGYFEYSRENLNENIKEIYNNPTYTNKFSQQFDILKVRIKYFIEVLKLRRTDDWYYNYKLKENEDEHHITYDPELESYIEENTQNANKVVMACSIAMIVLSIRFIINLLYVMNSFHLIAFGNQGFVESIGYFASIDWSSNMIVLSNIEILAIYIYSLTINILTTLLCYSTFKRHDFRACVTLSMILFMANFFIAYITYTSILSWLSLLVSGVILVASYYTKNYISTLDFEGKTISLSDDIKEDYIF